MCGIAGFSGSFDPHILTSMNQAQKHRGPDDHGVWYDESKGIGLAHRRLSIIDLSSSGHQPMWDAKGAVVVVYNGEIFNYLELKKSLVARGYTFRSHSDTEVLLNLYLDSGRDMLPRLNGMFAFALWDTRSDTLFLARDGIGVKPLYYTHTPKGFIFASELKALLQERSVDRTISPEAVHYHLSYLWCPAPHTMLKTVQKLDPGCALLVRDGSIQQQWRFYDVPHDDAASRHGPTVEQSVVQVQTYLQRAVERQMVSDVPVGAFLSGGLDSSSVVALARRCVPDEPLPCFTIGFRDQAMAKEGFAADLPYAQQVAKHLGVPLHTVYVGPEMADQLERMIYYLDEPQADLAPLNVLLISQLARDYGIKVLLSGAGGDDIFTGYRRHYALMQERYWAWMPKPLRHGLSWATHVAMSASLCGRRLAKAFKYASLDGDERIASYLYWGDIPMQLGLYGPYMREHLASTSVFEPMVSTLSRVSSQIHPLNRLLYLEQKHFLPDHNLNYTDKMSMATGVEVRVPLLDPDVLAMAARLPITFKQHGRVGKWIFKKAMEPYLPHDVIYRPKTGFGVPLRHWLRHELRTLVGDVLSETSLARRGLFAPAGVQRLMEEDRSGRVDGAYTILSLACIELWCRLFVDGQQPSTLAE